MVFNATFNNFSVLLMEETGENHRPAKSQTNFITYIMLYQIHLTMNGVRTRNFSGDGH
jgi:hypothetical protein